MFDAAPVATKLPLLVYSHGFGGNADMASYFLSGVAAAGSVVAARSLAAGGGRRGDSATPSRGPTGAQYRSDNKAQK